MTSSDPTDFDQPPFFPVADPDGVTEPDWDAEPVDDNQLPDAGDEEG